MLTIPEYKIGFNGSLVRRRLYDFTTDGALMNTDELWTRELLINSSVVAFSDSEYYYRSNPDSITKKFSPRLFEKSVTEALLVDFAKTYFPENQELVQTLRRKHFSGLQWNIVFYDKEKDKFTDEERRRIESVLAQSYKFLNGFEIMKDSLKWGIAVALLRRFSWYQRLVVSHFNKKNIK